MGGNRGDVRLRGYYIHFAFFSEEMESHLKVLREVICTRKVVLRLSFSSELGKD